MPQCGRHRPIDMMMNVLVVESRREQRARVVDALCELTGVNVRATADDVAAALCALDAGAFDVIVTADKLPDGATGALIGTARARGVRDVIVFGERDVPQLRDYWLDLGASRVVDTVPALVACTAGLVDARARFLDRTRRLDYLDVVAAPSAHSLTPFATGAAALRVHQDIKVGELLHSTLTRYGQILSPEVRVVLECVAGLPPVRCVPRDLERLVFHLVLDACEALPLGGTVWVVVEREGARHVRIEVLNSSGTARELAASTRELGSALLDADLRLIRHDGGATSVQIALPAIAGALN